MAKFRFKFETLLKQRKAREEEVLRALGAAQQKYQEELAARAAIEKRLEDSLIRREELGKIAVTIQAFHLEQDYITGLKQGLIRSQQAITRAMRGVEKALRTYLHARRQTKMMETLYEKHYAEFKKERAKKERKELEDLTIMRSRMASESEQQDNDLSEVRSGGEEVA